MEISKLKIKAQELQDLACKTCTKEWLEKHDNLTDPKEDINQCFRAGLITSQLKDRLTREVLEING